jgi:hypothetical protein
MKSLITRINEAVYDVNPNPNDSINTKPAKRSVIASRYTIKRAYPQGSEDTEFFQINLYDSCGLLSIHGYRKDGNTVVDELVQTSEYFDPKESKALMKLCDTIMNKDDSVNSKSS